MMFCPIHNIRRILTLIISVGKTNASIHDIAWVRQEIKATGAYYLTFQFLK